VFRARRLAAAAAVREPRDCPGTAWSAVQGEEADIRAVLPKSREFWAMRVWHLVRDYAPALVAPRRRFFIIDVVGASMEPTLKAGQRALAVRCTAASLRRGTLVILQHPAHFAEPARQTLRRRTPPGSRPEPRWLVKRVAAIPGDTVLVGPASGGPVRSYIVPPAHIVILGEVKESWDSRQLGFVGGEHVLGRVVAKLRGQGGRVSLTMRGETGAR